MNSMHQSLKETKPNSSHSLTTVEAWSNARLPPRYLAWRQSEQDHLLRMLQPGDILLDYCSGDCRVADSVLSRGVQYIGCDNDPFPLQLARGVYLSRECSFSVIQADLFDFAKFAASYQATHACILGNTFAELPCSPERILQLLTPTVSGDLLISVIAKGNLDARHEYYRGLQVPYQVDVNKEIFSSAIWGDVSAYSSEGLLACADRARVQVVSIEKATELGLVMRVRK